MPSNDIIAENQRLKQELTNLRNGMDNIGSYVFSKDVKGRYTYANEHIRALFSVPLSQIIGRTDVDFFDFEQCQDIVQNDKLVIEHRQTLEKEEQAILRHSGEMRYYWTVKHPIYDDKGQVQGLYGLSIDITERKRLEQELKQKELMLDTVLNNVDAFIYMKDRDFKFQYVNEKTSSLFQCPPEHIIGKTDKELHPDADDFNAMDRKVVATGQPVTGEEIFVDEHDNPHYYWSNKVPLKDEEGVVTSYIGFSHDITELIQLKQELEKRATTDDLTQLANRRHCFEFAEQEFKRNRRYDQHFSILLLDLDHFKKINDSFGHHVGDNVLKLVARCCIKTLRTTDMAGRIGGEEFCMILPQTGSQAASKLAERLRSEIENLDTSQYGHKLSLTTSIGIATACVDDKNLNQILIRADEALYKAKEMGRNQVAADCSS